MVFRAITPRLIEDDEGLIIDLREKDLIQYVEKDHVMRIETEPGMKDGKDYKAIYTQTIGYWEPPFDQVTVSSDKKELILKNLMLGLEFLKINYVLDHS